MKWKVKRKFSKIIRTLDEPMYYLSVKDKNTLRRSVLTLYAPSGKAAIAKAKDKLGSDIEVQEISAI